MRPDCYSDYLLTTQVLLQWSFAQNKNIILMYTGGKESTVLYRLLTDCGVVFRAVYMVSSGFNNDLSLPDQTVLNKFKQDGVSVDVIEDHVDISLSEHIRWWSWMDMLKRKYDVDCVVAGNRWCDNLRDYWVRPPMITMNDEIGLYVMYPLAIWSDGHLWRYISEKKINPLIH